MRKSVISSEISPKFDGVPTTDTLPIHEIMKGEMGSNRKRR